MFVCASNCSMFPGRKTARKQAVLRKKKMWKWREKVDFMMSNFKIVGIWLKWKLWKKLHMYICTKEERITVNWWKGSYLAHIIHNPFIMLDSYIVLGLSSVTCGACFCHWFCYCPASTITPLKMLENINFVVHKNTTCKCALWHEFFFHLT